jgi:hypothetical protein
VAKGFSFSSVSAFCPAAATVHHANNRQTLAATG